MKTVAREFVQEFGVQLDMPIIPNALFHTDCVDMMQRVEDESIDLIYLDPPLPAKRSSPASAAEQKANTDVSSQLDLISRVCQQGLRILKQTGALYFHTQPSSAFSIKLILNQIFGEDGFQDEIVWQYQQRPQIRQRGQHDVILCYGKSERSTNNVVSRPLNRDEVRRFSKNDERGPYALTNLIAPMARKGLQFEWHGVKPPAGYSWRFNLETLQKLERDGRIYSPATQAMPRLKRFLTENGGADAGTIWTDIPQLSPKSTESVKYPLQKPLGLLERLLHKGSHEGQVVLDPFCGSGTTLLAAERYQRKWIACDASKEAIEMSASRLLNEGIPVPNFTIGDAEALKQVPAISVRFKRVALGLNDYAAVIQFEYILNHPVDIEETRHFEFKEIKSSVGAIKSIINACDEYAVAFLNGEGGRVLWGIRDHDRVAVGVPLSYQQRDKVRRDVHTKLATIEPRVDPSQYRLEIHQIRDEHGAMVPDICIVELLVPASNSAGPHYTGGGEAWIKLDGNKQRLKGPALTEFIKNRFDSPKGIAAKGNTSNL
jgi:DNA modification methylase